MQALQIACLVIAISAIAVAFASWTYVISKHGTKLWFKFPVRMRSAFYLSAFVAYSLNIALCMWVIASASPENEEIAMLVATCSSTYYILAALCAFALARVLAHPVRWTRVVRLLLNIAVVPMMFVCMAVIQNMENLSKGFRALRIIMSTYPLGHVFVADALLFATLFN